MLKIFHKKFLFSVFCISKIIFFLSLFCLSFFLLFKFRSISYSKINKDLGFMPSPSAVVYESDYSNSDSKSLKRKETEILKYIIKFSDEISTSEAIKLTKIISEECDNYDLDPFLILAVIQVESHFSPSAVSKRGAIGLMQVMPSTADFLAKRLGISINGKKSLQNPFLNVRLGIYYLSLLEDRFKNIEDALFAYNLGPNRLESFKNLDMKPSSYVEKVMSFKSLIDRERFLSEAS